MRMTIAIVIILDFIYSLILRNEYGASVSGPFYSEIAKAVVMVVLSVIFYVVGIKYLSLWRRTGQLILVSYIFEFLALPAIVLTWMIKYQLWLLAEKQIIFGSFFLLFGIHVVFCSRFRRFIDQNYPLSQADLKLLGGTLPQKRIDMLIIDFLFWSLCTAPWLIFAKKATLIF